MIDHFTRWPEAVPIPYANVAVITRAFMSMCVARFVILTVITTEQGWQFQRLLWKTLVKCLGIKLAPATANHPAGIHPAGIRQASGIHPAGIRQASGIHPAGIHPAANHPAIGRLRSSTSKWIG
uniref:Integrase catalytic domain-containing protein n=1 Tax=Trichuris muris TaxID=70415 RepID=A0A5S6QK37_TRIMR